MRSRAGGAGERGAGTRPAPGGSQQPKVPRPAASRQGPAAQSKKDAGGSAAADPLRTPRRCSGKASVAMRVQVTHPRRDTPRARRALGPGKASSKERNPSLPPSAAASNRQVPTDGGSRVLLKMPHLQRLFLPLPHLSPPPSNSIPKRLNTFGFHGSLIFNEHPSSPNRKESVSLMHTGHAGISPGRQHPSPPKPAPSAHGFFYFSGLMGASSLRSRRSRGKGLAGRCRSLLGMEFACGQERELGCFSLEKTK